MEELVGRWWHEAVTHWTRPAYAAHAVQLKDVQKTIGMMFRAAGGPGHVRLAEASPQATGSPQNWLHRVAGSPQRDALPTREPEVLALPPALAVFGDSALNHDLYLWLAMLSAHFDHRGDWVSDNLRATQLALQTFPGFAPRYQQLLQAHLVQRPDAAVLKGRHAAAEHAVQAALRVTGVANTAPASPSAEAAPTHGADPAVVCAEVTPVWLWMGADTATTRQAQRDAKKSAQQADTRKTTRQDAKRRRASQRAYETERNPLILPFRAEALMSWSEMVRVNRSTDDEDDGSAEKVANDMDTLSITPDGQTLAARVKFDLDLPSSSADDLPLGPGRYFPEWDYRQGVLIQAHCCLQDRIARPGTAFIPSPALRRTARDVRRRLEILRDTPRQQRGQESGEDIDLDAWIRLQADALGHHGRRSDTPAVYCRRVRAERSLATLLLADLSQSTDAYASDSARVIDVIRDALFVFGEALHAVGDPFALWGFSSVRRHKVRMQHIKGFDERWTDATRARVGAIRPGYYTRMGAAVRHATAQLQVRPERQRLLMILTDGKPNDLDVYEGRYGLEDTRHAIHEARLAGLTPFCVTIDEAAHDYLPMLFGRHGYAMVLRPQDLVQRLTLAWTTLTR